MLRNPLQITSPPTVVQLGAYYTISMSISLSSIVSLKQDIYLVCLPRSSMRRVAEVMVKADRRKHEKFSNQFNYALNWFPGQALCIYYLLFEIYLEWCYLYLQSHIQRDVWISSSQNLGLKLSQQLFILHLYLLRILYEITEKVCEIHSCFRLLWINCLLG